MSQNLFLLAMTKIEEVLKHLGNNAGLSKLPYHLDRIAAAIAAHSNVDEIVYRGVANDDGPGDNVVLGKVEIVDDRSPGVYALPVTTATVYYRQELEEPLKRVVVVKEMAHLLMRGLTECCITSEDDLEALIEALSLTGDGAGELAAATPAVQSESIALLIATEILAPYRIRRGLLVRYRSGELTDEMLAETFGVPSGLVERLFKQEYLDLMERSRTAAAGARGRGTPEGVARAQSEKPKGVSEGPADD